LSEIEQSRSGPGRLFALALLLFAVSFAYFSLFLGYGINIEDEGTLLYQFERLADGQRAYTDFHLGYTPGVYYIHSTLQGMFDQSIVPGRIALALTNSLSVALLGLLVAPFCGIAAAFVAGLCYLAIPPVNPGFFASFNVPYPTWYSVTVFLAGLLVCRAHLARPTPSRALIAGVLAGLGFLFKPNIGAFQLAATMLLVLATVRRTDPDRGIDEQWLALFWWWGAFFASLVGVFAVFDFSFRRGEFSTFLLPMLACGVVCARRSSKLGRVVPSSRMIAITFAVMAGFVAVNLPWLGYYAARVPIDLLLREVFFVGSDYAGFFYRPHPIVLQRAFLFALAGLAFASVPAVLAKRALRPAPLLVTGAALASVVLAFVLADRPMIEGLYNAVMGEVEMIWIYPVTAALHWVALGVVWAWIGADSLLVLAVGSVFLYLQIYPRSDFMHWVTAGSLPIGLAFCLATLARERWAKGESGLMRTATLTVCLLPLLAIVALRFDRSFATVLAWTDAGIERRPAVTLAAERAPVWMNIGKAERYRDIDRVVRILDQVSKPDDKVLMFPALDVLSFLSDRHSPIHDTYFFPRWVGHDDEAAILSKLEADPPPFVVVHHELWPFFETAALYYYQLTETLERDYRRLAQVGRFAILVRAGHDVAAPAGSEIPWRSSEPGLAEHVERSLAGLDSAEKARALESLELDLIEGDYTPLTSSLFDDDPKVRDAAASALRYAESETVGPELLRAAYTDRLSPRMERLALRRGSSWAGRESVRLLMAMADDADAEIADAGAAGLGAASNRNLLRTFWAHRPSAAAWGDLGLDNLQRMRARAWLREPATDPRSKSFAVSVAAESGGLDELQAVAIAARRVEAARMEMEENEEAKETEAEDEGVDADVVAMEAEPQPDTDDPSYWAGYGLSAAIAQLVPQPLTRVSLLYRAAEAGGVEGASELALDFVSVDDMLASRAVLAALRRDPGADAMLAERVLSADAARYIETLLYLGATGAGCATASAARALIDDTELEEGQLRAARRVIAAHGQRCRDSAE
jgi:hypothetical protein